MNLLFVGADARFGGLLHVLSQLPEHVVTHCTDGCGAITELRRDASRYDWVVISGQPTALDSIRIARAIRTTGADIPVSFLSHADERGLPVGWGHPAGETLWPADDAGVFGDAPVVAVSGDYAVSGSPLHGRVLHYHAAPKKRRVS